jgi:hypothetical protein
VTKCAAILIAAAIAWGLLVLACWTYWVGVGRRQGGTLQPTSWRSILTMPLWTVHCWCAVGWERAAKRRAKRRHLRKLERMERKAPPGVPAELMARLQEEIDRLRDELHGRR